MVETSAAAPARPQDREWVGAIASVSLTCGLALAGGLLAGQRGMPDPLILAGVVSFLFCGVITALIVALSRRLLVRRGWPRAVQGARWASSVAALLNVAFWIAALIMVRRRNAPAPSAFVSTRPAAPPRFASLVLPGHAAARDVRLKRD